MIAWEVLLDPWHLLAAVVAAYLGAVAGLVIAHRIKGDDD